MMDSTLFFITGQLPANAETGVYNITLVLFSYIIAVLASYTALGFSSHLIKDDKKLNKKFIHISGACSMGAGIWSMHFVGMLSYKMKMLVEYNYYITFLSMLVAITVAYFALKIVSSNKLSIVKICYSAVLLGLGICLMHYMGMEAMLMDSNLFYRLDLFILSIIIAITASAAALIIMFHITRNEIKHKLTLKIIAALIMGLAICGMHYTGIEAAVFIPWADCRYDIDQDHTELAFFIIIVSFFILISNIYITLNDYKENNNIEHKVRFYFPILLIALFGLFSSYVSYYSVSNSEVKQAHNKFEIDAKKFSSNIKSNFSYELSVLRSIKAFYSSSGFVDREEFKTFASNILKDHDNILSVEYLKLLDSKDKVDFIDNVRKEVPEYSIINMKDGKEIEALIPVLYSFSFIEGYSMLGLNIASNKKMYNKAMEAVKNNTNVVSDPLNNLLGSNLYKDNIFIFSPIYKNKVKIDRDNRIESLDGILSIHFNSKDFLNKELKKSEFEGVKLKIYDITNKENEIIIFKNSNFETPLYSDKFYFNNRIWELRYGYNKGFYKPSHSKEYMVLLSVLGITLVIALYFLILLRQRRIEQINLKREQKLNNKLTKYTKELEKSKIEAEAANAQKSDFLANMSHEIRTPMSGVLGMTELLMNSKLSSEQFFWTNTIKNSGENLLEIINSILDFSKIEAGRVEIEQAEFPFIKNINEIMEILTVQAHEKNIELLLDLDDDIPEYLIGDLAHIRQVLLNLLSNAVKFTTEGYVLLRVSGDKIKDNKFNISFEIMDTGIGIPRDKQAYIFNKFSQAEESTTRKYGGTGLGLAISKQLANLMGGDITVDSDTDSGSKFTFVLELGISDKKDSMHQLNNHDLGGLKVAVIEGQEIHQQIFNKYLSSYNMKVKIFGTYLKAYNDIKKQYKNNKPYDLVIISNNLELKIDAIKILDRFKNDADFKEKPKVLLSTSGNIATDKELKGNGVDGLVRKPIFPKQLKGILEIMFSDVKLKNDRKSLVTRHILTNLTRREVQSNGQEVFKIFDNAKILVVEDITVNLILIKKILSNFKCDVDAALNGKQALDMVKEKHYDLIFMDCQMPVMDGFESTKLIRKHENKNKSKTRTTIVALTADAMIGDKEKCLNIGMDDYLNKPFKMKDIENMLAKWLEN